MDAVNNNSKEVFSPTSTDRRKMINMDGRESDEGIEKYVVDNNIVGNQRGPKRMIYPRILQTICEITILERKLTQYRKKK